MREHSFNIVQSVRIRIDHSFLVKDGTRKKDVKEIYPGSDRTSLMATLPHRAGSLYEVIREFAEAGYNLTKLESRPIPNTDFEFMFYFDFESSVYRDDFIDVLERVEKLCDKMEYLGSYSEKF